MKRISIFIIAASLVLTPVVAAYAQEPVPVTKNYLAWAHEFLRTMYPDLSGKKYFLTVETAVEYDLPGKLLQPDVVYVGEGPEFQVRRIVTGHAQPAPPPPGVPAAPPREDKDFVPGPQHPKQVLKAGFRFDSRDRLEGFGADGTGIGNSEAATAFSIQVGDHPEMTDAEVIAALKKAGAKYGPNDREAFIRNLPIAKLQRFLGKLKIVSVGFLPLNENRDNAFSWPYWTVMAEATRRDGTVVTYRLLFEQFKGDLLGIGTGPSR